MGTYITVFLHVLRAGLQGTHKCDSSCDGVITSGKYDVSDNALVRYTFQPARAVFIYIDRKPETS